MRHYRGKYMRSDCATSLKRREMVTQIHMINDEDTSIEIRICVKIQAQALQDIGRNGRLW